VNRKFLEHVRGPRCTCSRLISLSSGVCTEKSEWFSSFLNIGNEKSKKDPDPPEPSTAEEFAAELEGALHIKEQEAIIAEVP